MSENKVLSVMPKNSVSKLVFTLSEFKGKKYLDIRTYVIPDEGDHVPTKKGISIPIQLYREFRKAFLEAEIALLEHKVFDQEDLADEYN